MNPLSRERLLRGTSQRQLRELTLAAMSCHQRDQKYESIRAAGVDIIPRWLPFAQANRVTPIVAHALFDVFGEDIPMAAEWHAAHEQNAQRMRTLLSEFDRIAAAMAEVGVRMLALKNAGIARGLYPCAACCPMGDLDVVVKRGDFHVAHDVMLSLGYPLATRTTTHDASFEEGFEDGGTEYRAVVDGEEVWFELQWRPVAGRWIRQDQEPDADDLVDRSVPIPGTDVRLLSPVDNMVQVALHTAKHTYVRAPGLRLHTDVDRITRYQAPDWSAVCDMVEALEVKTATFLSFALANALLDTPIPDEVFQRLRPNRAKLEAMVQWLMRVDLFLPNEPKFSRPEMIGFTALMYDDTAGLLASVLDTDKSDLLTGNPLRHARRGARRVRDLITRYDR